MKLTNYKSISEQNGGSVLSFILPLVGSLLPSLLKKDLDHVVIKKIIFLKN